MSNFLDTIKNGLASVKRELESVDVDGNGVPTYRDLPELLHLAGNLVFLGGLLPPNTEVYKAANHVGGLLDKVQSLGVPVAQSSPTDAVVNGVAAVASVVQDVQRGDVVGAVVSAPSVAGAVAGAVSAVQHIVERGG